MHKITNLLLDSVLSITESKLSKNTRPYNRSKSWRIVSVFIPCCFLFTVYLNKIIVDLVFEIKFLNFRYLLL